MILGMGSELHSASEHLAGLGPVEIAAIDRGRFMAADRFLELG